MKKLLMLLGLIAFAVPVKAQTQMAQPVKPIVPTITKLLSDMTISTGTAVELTGNTGVVSTTAGYFGIKILNWDTAGTIYCCANDSSCSASAGAHHGDAIRPRPSGANENWSYWSIPAWEKMYCVSDTVSLVANVTLFK